MTIIASELQSVDANEQHHWYLEGFNAQGEHWHIPLHTFPFRVGRSRSNELCLSFSGISRHHAEIQLKKNALWIKECGSTNGTFVNRTQVNEMLPLHADDIIHFGLLEFRLCNRDQDGAVGDNTQVLKPTDTGQHTVASSEQSIQLIDLLRRRLVAVRFQSILHLQSYQQAGCELLGKGQHPDLPVSPKDLIDLAESTGRAVQLSELFRDVGVRRAVQLGLRQPLFINTVPQEINFERMKLSLQRLREFEEKLPLVLEIHEKSVTSLKTMRELRSVLADLRIELAYDDFGAGQARLRELIEVPPDWLKFDISLISNIHHQPPRAQQVISALVGMARDLGIKTVAEGIEIAAEKLSCEALGFDYGQGYYLSRPSTQPTVTTAIRRAVKL